MGVNVFRKTKKVILLLRKLQAFLEKQDEKNEAYSKRLDEMQSELKELRRLIGDALYNTEEERSYLSPEYIEKQNSTKKEKILLCGYYGAQNGGDELMLRAILGQIPADKDVTILLSHNYSIDSIEYFPYKTLHYPKKTDDCRYLAENFDTIIWGGGAVIDDDHPLFSGADNNLSYIEMTISKMALKLKKRVIILGISSNKELHNAGYIEDLQGIINGANFFSLRDTNSLQTLERAGLDTKKVAIIDDLAFLNHYEDYALKGEKDTLGLVLINNNNEEQIVSFIKNIQSCLEETGLYSKIKLISFFNQYRHDFHALNSLKEQCERDGSRIKIEVVDTRLNEKGISEVLSSCGVIMSMRYHATLISSTILGIKTICVNYGEKHPHYYNKNKYIKDAYVSKMPMLDFNDCNDVKKICKAIETASVQKIEKRRLQDIRSRLEDVIKKTI